MLANYRRRQDSEPRMLPHSQVFPDKQFLDLPDPASGDGDFVAAAQKQKVSVQTGRDKLRIDDVRFVDPYKIRPQCFLYIFHGFGNKILFTLTCIYVGVISFSPQVRDLAGSEPKYLAGNVDCNVTGAFPAGESNDPGIQ